MNESTATTTLRRPPHYWEIWGLETPLEVRKRSNVGSIWKNAAKCLKCNDEIRSNHVHDYVTCSCGSIVVAGGSWYAKRTGEPYNMANDIVRYNEVEKLA